MKTIIFRLWRCWRWVSKNYAANKLRMVMNKVLRSKPRLKEQNYKYAKENIQIIYLLSKTLLDSKGRFLAETADDCHFSIEKVPLSESVGGDAEDLDGDKNAQDKKDRILSLAFSVYVL